VKIVRSLLKDKLLEVLGAVAPLIAVVIVLQVVLVGAPTMLFLQFLAGSALVVVGMVLLFIGVDFGILPMARFIGAELPKKKSIGLIVVVTFALGLATTLAEPDVLVLSSQVDLTSQGTIRSRVVAYVISVGLAVFVSIAMARVVYGFPMTYLLAGAYSLVIVLSFLAPAEFVPLAYDAGSVTTGVLTTPVVISLAVGLSSVLAGRSAVSDGFGLLGFAAIGPIIAVMLVGLLR
jgi:hypothetical protein